MEMPAAACRYVQVTIRDHAASVVLYRPPVNALSQDFAAELTRVALKFQHEEDVWVVALSARGKTFCAGADLKERAGTPSEDVAEAVKSLQRMVAAWIDIPQPVIAGLQGAALGGGLELALTADIIAACDGIKLGLPEVTLGIIPAAGGTQRIAQRSSLGKAGKWVLTGARFTAAEALSDGVIDYVFAASSFEEDFGRLVARLASCAPLSLREAKRALNARYRAAFLNGLGTEMECYGRLIDSADRTEALLAFAEKRKPVWRKS